ncbi:MAG TPA: rRNA maturation RNase YbeY [Anaeromyxobacteraceae bacterium]|nr:rRNA maturation RNase YbeY [Anaeromyxobacteraceae bacterium]
MANDHPRGAAASRRLVAQAGAFLEALGRAGAELSVLLTTDRRIRALNRRWRDIDRATDVLSFPLSEPAGSGPLLGDVVISMDTAVRRARRDGRRVQEELDRYLAHGLLHLLGFDHRRPEEARRMARAEADLIGSKGLLGRALSRRAL